MIFSNINKKCLHTCVTKQTKPLNISAISDKTYYSQTVAKNNLTKCETPLISFTSFQHYLDDYNQVDFYKKQNKKFHRSVNKAKTQAYFTYQRQKSNTSQQKRQKIRNFTLEDSVIQSFSTTDQYFTKNINYKKIANRSITSKSQSDNYLPQTNSIAQEILNQKFGTIEGWSSQLKCDINQRVFVSSKNILQQRKLNLTKNRLKTSQNSIRKQKKTKSITQGSENLEPKKVFKSKRSANKQNIKLTQISQKSPKSITSQDHLFRPIEILHKQKTKNNPLTSINELQEEILLSRRQPNLLGSSSSRYNQNQQLLKAQNSPNHAHKQNTNLKMLKKQFEYLCKDEIEQDNQQFQFQKSLSSQIDAQNSFKSNKKPIKPFKRFPNNQNKQNSTCYPFDTSYLPINTNRPKTTQNQINQSSPSMLKILQSINHSTTNEKYLYQPKTPLPKSKKTPQNELNTPHTIKRDDMKSVSKHKERFNVSIKDRKSHSAFHSNNAFGGIENEQKMLRNYEGVMNENPLMITVVSSFQSCGSKPQNKYKWNSKNYSFSKGIKSRLQTEYQAQRDERINSTDIQSNTNQPSQFKDESTFGGIGSNNQQLQGLTFDITNHTFSENNIQTEPNQSLQKLNMLSQQLKKCTKTPTSTKYVSFANKKFIYLNKASKINHREKHLSILKHQKKNIIENLTITQLQGRHIEKLRKQIDIKQ